MGGIWRFLRGGGGFEVESVEFQLGVNFLLLFVIGGLSLMF